MLEFSGDQDDWERPPTCHRSTFLQMAYNNLTLRLFHRATQRAGGLILYSAHTLCSLSSRFSVMQPFIHFLNALCPVVLGQGVIRSCLMILHSNVIHNIHVAQKKEMTPLRHKHVNTTMRQEAIIFPRQSCITI